MLPARGVGVIELRGESVTPGYVTMGGFLAAQDENGWYNTGDLGYLTEKGHVVVCGRVKDVIIMAGRNIYPTDIERAAGRVDGVRPAAPSPCGWRQVWTPRTSARPSRLWWSPTHSRTRTRCGGSSSRLPTRLSPR